MTLTPKVKVIGQKAGICDGVPSTSALVFHAFLSAADFYHNQLFRKILSGISSECQTVWTQIRPVVGSAVAQW